MVILELLRNDRVKEAYEYYEINVDEERRRLDKMEAESEVDRAKEEFKAKYKNCQERLRFAENMKTECRKKSSGIPSTTSIQLFSEFVKFLHGLTQNKCPYLNCKKESKKVKKEGANKIFLIDREAEEDEEGANATASSANMRKKSRDSISRG